MPTLLNKIKNLYKPGDRVFITAGKSKLKSVDITLIEETIMPSGHASHKGASQKPNTNANGLINAAAEGTADPHDITTQGSDPTRTEEAPENAAATQRPEDEAAQ